MTDRNDAMKSEEPGEDRSTLTLGENTPVRLGLVVVISTALVGGIVWNATNAAKVNTKLDTLTSMLGKVATVAEVNERRVSDHIAEDRKMWTEVEARLAVLERSGSEKTRELEREISVLRRDFEVHKAVAPLTPGRL